MTVVTEFDEDAAWAELAASLRGRVGQSEFAAAGPRLREHWLAWRPLVRELRFGGPDQAEPLLALWLDQAVEEAVDRAWRQSPAEGFLLDILAGELCKAELRGRLAKLGGVAAERQACLPLPPLGAGLAAALNQAGLAGKADFTDGAAPGLARRYALLTYERSRGCAACALLQGCPKLDNQENSDASPGAGKDPN